MTGRGYNIPGWSCNGHMMAPYQLVAQQQPAVRAGSGEQSLVWRAQSAGMILFGPS